MKAVVSARSLEKAITQANMDDATLIELHSKELVFRKGNNKVHSLYWEGYGPTSKHTYDRMKWLHLSRVLKQLEDQPITISYEGDFIHIHEALV